MTDALIVLTPLIVLLILALFRFTGCGSFGTAPSAETPEPAAPVVTPTPTPPAPPTYEQVVAKTPGFAAHWPLNETAGNIASVKGMLAPAANGQYVTGVPAGTGLKLGEPGIPFKSGDSNLAPEFAGTAAYVDVPFNAPLNPSNMTAFSVEVWVKPTTPGNADTQVVVSSRRVNTETGYEVSLVRLPNEPHQQIRGRVFSPTGPVQVTVQPNVGDPQDWRHVVFVYAGNPDGSGTITLYVRIAKSPGLFQGGPVNVPISGYVNIDPSTPATLRFGASHRGGQDPGSFFAGRIDEVAFYNGVLSLSDIDQHFNMV